MAEITVYTREELKRLNYGPQNFDSSGHVSLEVPWDVYHRLYKTAEAGLADRERLAVEIAVAVAYERGAEKAREHPSWVIGGESFRKSADEYAKRYIDAGRKETESSGLPTGDPK